ncbi:MAG TPA: MerR family transcriptional regulator [Candidatus Eisenbacteria bacterium]|nr:MerR family transcriptional regulator [Candidatus Eisenbacteria bacterium]
MVAQKALKKAFSQEIDGDEPIYTSGVVSRLLSIPLWVLKQLDKENVVKPPRQKGRYRYYSQNELKRLEHAWYYINVRQVNVHGLKVILDMEEKNGR